MRKGNTVGDEVLIATCNSKNRTVTDGHLTEIFSAVGQRYGCEDVNWAFSATILKIIRYAEGIGEYRTYFGNDFERLSTPKSIRTPAAS